jgi:hypothetical protein
MWMLLANIGDLAQTLKDYGGWGVSAMLAVAFVGYYWHSQKVQKELFQSLEARHDQSMELTTKVTTAVNYLKQIQDWLLQGHSQHPPPPTPGEGD